MPTVRIIGDVHGKYEPYKKIIAEVPASIQVGDMGVGFRRNGGARDGEFYTNPPHYAMVRGNHRFIRGNHDCCDEQTECLTRRGWTKHDQISSEDEVLSLTKDGTAVWSKIKEVVHFPYSGEMIRIETSRLSMSLTPNHRVLLTRKHWKTRERFFTFEEARNLKSSFEIPVAGIVKQPGIDLSDDAISLVGWILTDGCFDRTNYSISIYQSKPDGMAAIELLLDRLCLSHKKSVRQRNIAAICGRKLLQQPLPQCSYLLHASAVKRVSQWVSGKTELPTWAYDMNGRQFEILLNAIVAGDGVWDGVDPSRKSHCVIYGVVSLLESIQRAAVCHGWRARLAIDNRGDPRLCLTRKSTLYVEGRWYPEFREPYEGVVWCVRVPHENFMVRRRGCAYFTGNSPSECRKHSQWIPDGRIEDDVMFIGGALSVDREWRTEGYDWWTDEELSIAELNTLVDVYRAARPRIMVTHDCPESVAETMCKLSGRNKLDFPSRTRQALRAMFEVHQPETWLFGHWHSSFDHVIDGTRFICLAELEYRDIDV